MENDDENQDFLVIELWQGWVIEMMVDLNF
jgi:hypothetical protein